ncbi:MAG TPA: hypothetical protein DDY49_13495 [Paenibacillaceae bacterium]|nr:hypothetical protein [Paenibacillaceae bacterium]
MKKLLAVTLASLVVFGVPTQSFAFEKSRTAYVNEIIKMEPSLTAKELLKNAEEISKTQKTEIDAVLKQIYGELVKDAEKAKKEQGTRKAYGEGGGKYIIGVSTKGDIYYTPSSTAYLNHGHVGMYYATNIVIESVPKYGVRKYEKNHSYGVIYHYSFSPWIISLHISRQY